MKTKRKKQPEQTTTTSSQGHKQPLIEHLKELKRRVFYVGLVVVAGSIAAYAAERTLVDILLKPSHGQQFIYTSPLGGMNFLFGVCFRLGLVVATPVIIYNLLAFLKPLMGNTTHKFLVLSSFAATVTAVGGLLFGYFIGLPSALNFLLHQFTNLQIKPLITIQSYMSFVAIYLLGSALMFQLPLIILFINRIKPLKPGGLLKYERHAIAGSFIVAFIMNPTPNIIDQLLVVIPVLAMYQLSIIMVWLVNRTDIKKVRETTIDIKHQFQEFEQVTEAGQQAFEQVTHAAGEVLQIARPVFVPAVAMAEGQPTKVRMIQDVVPGRHSPQRVSRKMQTTSSLPQRQNFQSSYSRRLIQ